jgi:predicted transcriptional regulator
MSRLSELATELVSAHASTTPMTKEELIQELQDVYKTLLQLETQGSVEAEEEQSQPAEALTITKRKAFGKDKIYCMICGKPFTTLKRHLAVAHEMKPGAYRKQFNIPTSTPLTSKNYSESRKQMALDKDLGAGLAKARAARKKQA